MRRSARRSERGKWLCTETSQGWLLLNMGMGGEILLVDREHLPEKRRLVFDFCADGTCLAVNFWWFGSAHYLPPGPSKRMNKSPSSAPNVLEIGREQFGELVRDQKGGVKAFLLDQSRLAGIGNAYIHDILWLAALSTRSASSTRYQRLKSTRSGRGSKTGCGPSVAKGGAFYEVGLAGQKGGFLMEDIIVGYREGMHCRRCGTAIAKIKTGGTSQASSARRARCSEEENEWQTRPTSSDGDRTCRPSAMRSTCTRAWRRPSRTLTCQQSTRSWPVPSTTMPQSGSRS